MGIKEERTTWTWTTSMIIRGIWEGRIHGRQETCGTWAIIIKERAKEERARARIIRISVEAEDIGTRAKARARTKAKAMARGIKEKEKEMADIKERGRASRAHVISVDNLGTPPRSALITTPSRDIVRHAASGATRQEIAKAGRSITWNLMRRGIYP